MIDKAGDVGRKLHTGRSRNDQVALDMRLCVREEIADITGEIIELQNQLIHKAYENSTVIMPGYTHLQHAQPVSLSHHLLAYYWKLQRDIGRLADCYKRTNVSPLGSGALAGTSFKIDRTIASRMLGMDGITENSLDSVSDRDFVAETAFAVSLLMIHLSSLCEELVLWSSQEFGFIELPKEMSSGSSMMPQKRNPDLPELVRGKSARAIGDLVTVLTLLKSLPLAYNRDLQEDKETFFDACDTVESSLYALTQFLQAMQFDGARMRMAAEAGLMTATDLADFLTQHGVPFRTAHASVKEIAEKAGRDDVEFRRMAVELVRQQLGTSKTADLDFASAATAVDRRDSEGGTAPKATKVQLEKAAASMIENMRALSGIKKQLQKMDALLE
jgi:argininosuccinate lyase